MEEQTEIECPCCKDDYLCKIEVTSDYTLLTKQQYHLNCNCCGFKKLVLQL